MKKLLLVAMFVATSVATFVACSKTDEPVAAPVVVNNDPIIGVWKKIAETKQLGLTGTPVNNFSGCAGAYQYMFKADYTNDIKTYTQTGAVCNPDAAVVNYKWQNNGDATHYYYQIRKLDGTIIDDELECTYNSTKSLRYATYKDGIGTNAYYIKSTFQRQ
jgi:hypothetical protein